ncbi:thioredoxin [Tepiditoga spiralis]|uniref:Thioredoxin n=1 Tax=Tepiditoga spiralis TaxID=2108365 RepID=A0A7G1G3Z9_9BACT|nr:thioredoxin fold domain-containing protein [Tepiditoga spiralis]BBE30795.1 thioredoxin [Tepiditoga spiralis]
MKKLLNFKFSIFVMLIISISIFSVPLNNFVLRNFNDAFTVSKITGKKVIIMFSSEECYYCKKFEEEILTNKDVQKWLRTEFVFAEITAKNDGTADFRNKKYTYPQLFGAFGVRGTPTFVFFEDEDNFLGSIPGYVEANTFENLLKYLLFKDNTKVQFQDFIKKDYGINIRKRSLNLNKKDIETLLKIDPNTKIYNKSYDDYTNVVVDNENNNYKNFIIIKEKSKK